MTHPNTIKLGPSAVSARCFKCSKLLRIPETNRYRILNLFIDTDHNCDDTPEEDET